MKIYTIYLRSIGECDAATKWLIVYKTQTHSGLSLYHRNGMLAYFIILSRLGDIGHEALAIVFRNGEMVR